MSGTVFPESPIAGRDPDDDRREVAVGPTGRVKVEAPGLELLLQELLQRMTNIEILLADALNRDTVTTL